MVVVNFIVCIYKVGFIFSKKEIYFIYGGINIYVFELIWSIICEMMG